MPKAFLSHSSKDQDIVSRVFKELGTANAHYDKATFEQGERSADEIYKALSNTDVFALFVSKHSVRSQWVQSEIAASKQKIFSGDIKKVLVFILDDTTRDQLPPWLRDHVYRSLASPRLIAKAIRSTLLDIALNAGLEIQFFIGRDVELGQLKGALAQVSTSAPDVIFLSGIEGIGRRSLAKRALLDTYPSLSKFPVEIQLSSTEGDVDFYKHLLSYGDDKSLGTFMTQMAAFSSASPQQRLSRLLEEVGKIVAQRQFVILRGQEAIIQDDGDFQQWLAQFVRNLQNIGVPQLVVIARRVIPHVKRNLYPNAYFSGVQSLSRENSKNLLNLWLKQLGASFPDDLLEDVVQDVSGHPKNIEIAARYCAEVGVARINTGRAEFMQVIGARARALIETITLAPEQQQILALFKDYEYLSADDLLTVVPFDDPTIEKSLAYLQDHGILEKEDLHGNEWVIFTVFRASGACRSEPSAADIPHRAVHTLGAG